VGPRRQRETERREAWALACGIGLGLRHSARGEEMGRAGDAVKAAGALAGLRPELGPRRGAWGWPKSKGARPAQAKNVTEPTKL
jgi:hypothetical protein